MKIQQKHSSELLLISLVSYMQLLQQKRCCCFLARASLAQVLGGQSQALLQCCQPERQRGVWKPFQEEHDEIPQNVGLEE